MRIVSGVAAQQTQIDHRQRRQERFAQDHFIEAGQGRLLGWRSPGIES